MNNTSRTSVKRTAHPKTTSILSTPPTKPSSSSVSTISETAKSKTVASTKSTAVPIVKPRTNTTSVRTTSASRNSISSKLTKTESDSLVDDLDNLSISTQVVMNISRSSRTQKVQFEKNTKWYSGPTDAQGRLFTASDRNLLCMSVLADEFVVGGADHGLKVYNSRTGKMTRELFSKKYGHHEWVTCVDYLLDGRIISGAMDSKLCLWDKRIVKCIDLHGHSSSISCVKSSDDCKYAVSGSYDRSLIVWNLKDGRPSTQMKGHKDAIVDFVWYGSTLLSGDRVGVARLWDVNTGLCTTELKGHKGQISALDVVPEYNLAFTGALDGDFRIWDLRSGSPLFQETLHPGGAVSSIDHSYSTRTIITAGADKKIKVMDPKNSFKLVHTFTDHKDFIYSMKVVDSLCFSGAGSGWLLVHDLEEGNCLYGLGANQHAVRCMEVNEKADQLITAGDDGSAIVFDFS